MSSIIFLDLYLFVILGPKFMTEPYQNHIHPENNVTVTVNTATVIHYACNLVHVCVCVYVWGLA
jgi:hypothetical protein